MAGEDTAGLTAVAGGELERELKRAPDAVEVWTAADGRKFGLATGGAFLALAGLFWWRGHAALLWPAAVLGVAFGSAGLLVPSRLGPIHRAWMKGARAISKVTTPVVLGLVYYAVLTPAGMLRRHLGGNPLRREERDGGFWVRRDRSERSELERQF